MGFIFRENVRDVLTLLYQDYRTISKGLHKADSRMPQPFKNWKHLGSEERSCFLDVNTLG
jgi:hypothetical protein